MPDDRELPEGVPLVTEDIGLPTPPNPGRLPPPHLPPAPDPVPLGEEADTSSGEASDQ